MSSLYFFALVPILVAAFIGFTGPKSSGIAAIQSIFFPIVVFLVALLIGHVFEINPLRVLAFLGFVSIVFIFFALLTSGRKSRQHPKNKT